METIIFFLIFYYLFSTFAMVPFVDYFADTTSIVVDWIIVIFLSWLLFPIALGNVLAKYLYK